MSRRRKPNRRRPQGPRRPYAGPVLRSGEFLHVGEDVYELTLPRTAVSDEEWAQLISEGWVPGE